MVARGRLVRTVVRGNRAGLAWAAECNAPGNSDASGRGARLDDRVQRIARDDDDGRRRRAALDRRDGDRQPSDWRATRPTSTAAACTSSASGSPALRSATVSGNTSDNDGNATGTGGGVRFEGSGAISIRNTVLADNSDKNPVAAPDCSKDRHRRAGHGLQPSRGHRRRGMRVRRCGRRDLERPGPRAARQQRWALRGRKASTPAARWSTAAIPTAAPTARRARWNSTSAAPASRAVEDGKRRTGPLRCDKGGVRKREQRRARVRERPADHRGGSLAAGHARLLDPEGAAVTYGGATAQHGTVTGSGAARTYTPAQDYTGADTISFTASDEACRPSPRPSTSRSRRSTTRRRPPPTAAARPPAQHSASPRPACWPTTPTSTATR